MDESETHPKDYYPENTARTLSSSSAAATTSVQVTALDDLVNVNSLFTIAVFGGLSLTTSDQHSLENPGACDVVKKLLVFEVVSFSFFLFSSLVAQGLKLAINLLNSKDVNEALRAHINIKVLRFGMVGSAFGSVMGCLFLMLSMISLIEIRLGILSCGSKSAVHAVSDVTSWLLLLAGALLESISLTLFTMSSMFFDRWPECSSISRKTIPSRSRYAADLFRSCCSSAVNSRILTSFSS